jgi:diguanylate cyclase (GGDEF)-like protein
LDWASFIFGAFVSCVAGFGATAVVFAWIMRRQSIAWMAARALAIGLLALTFPPAGPWLFPDPHDATIARLAATDLVIAVVGPLLATYIEPAIKAPRLRAALWSGLPLGLALAASTPLAVAYPAVNWLHHILILLLVTGVVVALGLALRLGSRTARYQAIAWAPTILTGFLALYHELVLFSPMPFYAEAMLASFLFEFVVTAAGIGHGFVLTDRELVQAVRNVDEATRVSTLDPLTGIANRRGLATRFSDPELRRPVALAVIDCDHFKRINDNFGHDLGDDVLVAVADALRGDELFVGRLGGEEFVALIYGADWQTLAEEARRRVSVGVRLRLPQLGVRVTASAGVAVIRDEDTLRTAIKRADRALYAAKDAGRDRLMLAAQEDDTEPKLARVG